MALPTMTGVGRLTASPELRFSASGTAVCTVNIAFNSRRKDASGEWVDGDVLYMRGTAFKQLAEHVSETFEQGHEVIVTGRLKTDQWEDRETGAKRSAVSMLIDSIGPSLAWATAKVAKADRSGPSKTQDVADDPWGSAPAHTPAGVSEPPF